MVDYYVLKNKFGFYIESVSWDGQVRTTKRPQNVEFDCRWKDIRGAEFYVKTGWPCVIHPQYKQHLEGLKIEKIQRMW